MPVPLRELLNDHKWHHQDLRELDILVVHRGAPNDQRVVAGWAIQEVTATGIVLDGFLGGLDDATGESTFVPYHRFLEVRRGSEVLWRKGA